MLPYSLLVAILSVLHGYGSVSSGNRLVPFSRQQYLPLNLGGGLFGVPS